MKRMLMMIAAALLTLGVAARAEEKKAEPVTKVAVDGMSCGVCSSKVTKKLKGTDGVKDVFVSVKDKAAYVVCKDGMKDDDLKAAVTSAGFTAGKVEKTTTTLEEAKKQGS